MLPLTAPRSTVEPAAPSPKFTETSLMAAAPVPGVTFTVKFEATRAVGEVGAVMAIVGAAYTDTFTVPVLAPTVAVTVAACVVVSCVVA
jgi:hypothetical protein